MEGEERGREWMGGVWRGGVGRGGERGGKGGVGRFFLRRTKRRRHLPKIRKFKKIRIFF